MLTINRTRLYALVNLAAFKAKLTDAERWDLLAWASTTDTVAAGFWHVKGCQCPAMGTFGQRGSGFTFLYKDFAFYFDTLIGYDVDTAEAFRVIG